MFDNAYWRPSMFESESSNTLLNKIIYFCAGRSGYVRSWACIVGLILLAGLSNPVWAFSENVHNGSFISRLNLNFSSSPPITISRMMVAARSEIGDAPRGLLDYDIDSELSNADVSSGMLRSGLPSDSKRARDGRIVLRPISGKLAPETSSASKPGMSVATQSDAKNLADSPSVVTSESEDNTRANTGLLNVGGGRQPFGTVVLAILALLGVVSVARR